MRIISLPAIAVAVLPLLTTAEARPDQFLVSSLPTQNYGGWRPIPDIDQDLVVWGSDSRDGVERVYVHNLLTGAEYPVGQNNDQPDATAIRNGTVVWADRSAGLSSSYYLNVGGGAATLLSSSSAWIEHVAVSRTHVAVAPYYTVPYQDTWSTLVRNLSSGNVFLVSAQSWAPRCMAMSDDYIVWSEGGYSLHAYQISKGIELPLNISGSGISSRLSVSGSIAVWETIEPWESKGSLDIRAVDLRTGRQFAIADSPGVVRYSPKIDGDLVVWSQYDTFGDYSNGAIYAHRLSTGETFPVATGGRKSSPAVSGNTVVWVEDAATQQPSIWRAGIPSRKRPVFHAIMLGVQNSDGRRGDLDVEGIRNALLRFPGLENTNDIRVVAPDDNWREVLRSMDFIPGDSLLFYYAGHGGFLNTHDEPIVNTSQAAQQLRGEPAYNDGDEALTNPAVGDDELASLLGDPRMNGVSKLVVLDACHSGGFWGKPGNSSDIGDLDKVNKCYLISSAPEEDIGYYSSLNGRGYFSMGLEAALTQLWAAGLPLFTTLQLEEKLNELYRPSNFEGPARVSEAGASDDIPIGDISFSLFSIGAADFDAAAPVIVPEPAMLSLLAMGGMALIRRRRTA